MEIHHQELEAELGHGFASPELLSRALTHRSLANQIAHEAGNDPSADSKDNERLEFLGDAVLNLIVAEALFELHPEWHEGELDPRPCPVGEPSTYGEGGCRNRTG